MFHEFYPFGKDKTPLNLDSKAGLNHEQVGDVGGGDGVGHGVTARSSRQF